MNRTSGWLTVRDYLRGEKEYQGTELVEVPKVFVTANCIHSIEIIPTIQYNPKDANDIEEVNDDLPDEWRYGLMSRAQPEDKPARAKSLQEQFKEPTLNELWEMKKELNRRR